MSRFISNSLMHLIDSKLQVRYEWREGKPEWVCVVVNQLKKRFDHRRIQYLR